MGLSQELAVGSTKGKAGPPVPGDQRSWCSVLSTPRGSTAKLRSQARSDEARVPFVRTVAGPSSSEGSSPARCGAGAVFWGRCYGKMKVPFLPHPENGSHPVGGRGETEAPWLCFLCSSGSQPHRDSHCLLGRERMPGRWVQPSVGEL